MSSHTVRPQEDSNAPQVPPHPEKSFQSAVEAVKIYVDLAWAIMTQNKGINEDDWKWFHAYLEYLNNKMEAAQAAAVFDGNTTGQDLTKV